MKYSAVLAVLLAATAAAQQVPQFPVSAEAVYMTVTITGKHGPLAEDAFTVIENGREQRLTLFSSEPVPLDIVLLLDVSRSVGRTEARNMNRLAMRFVDALGRGDRMQIMHFGVNASTTQEFTGNRDALMAAIKDMRRQDATALRQAMYVALAQLRLVPTPPDCPRRRVLVVFTDAVDTQSYMDGETLRRGAHEAQASVYIVSVKPDVLQWTASQDREYAESRYLLASISQETGGVYFESESFIQALEIAKRIVRDFSAQYTLGWQSDSPADQSFRRVQVRVRGLSTEKYRHPTGYLVSRQP